MKVGGNAAASEYFSKHGIGALNNKNANSKYTSRAALKYKEELLRRAKEDAAE